MSLVHYRLLKLWDVTHAVQLQDSSFQWFSVMHISLFPLPQNTNAFEARLPKTGTCQWHVTMFYPSVSLSSATDVLEMKESNPVAPLRTKGIRILDNWLLCAPETSWYSFAGFFCKFGHIYIYIYNIIPNYSNY